MQVILRESSECIVDLSRLTYVISNKSTHEHNIEKKPEWHQWSKVIIIPEVEKKSYR